MDTDVYELWVRLGKRKKVQCLSGLSKKTVFSMKSSTSTSVWDHIVDEDTCMLLHSKLPAVSIGQTNDDASAKQATNRMGCWSSTVTIDRMRPNFSIALVRNRIFESSDVYRVNKNGWKDVIHQDIKLGRIEDLSSGTYDVHMNLLWSIFV